MGNIRAITAGVRMARQGFGTRDGNRTRTPCGCGF